MHTGQALNAYPSKTQLQREHWKRLTKLTSPPHGRATFEALADLFAKHRGDRRVTLELELRGPAQEDRPLRVRAGLAAQVRVQVSEQLSSEVERICGKGTVVLR